MKKISMRFCQRNLEEEGSQEILDEQSKHNGDLVQIETEGFYFPPYLIM
jgi:hypothetical protein